MKISIMGSGYVGLTAAAGLCRLGHDVICVDVDEEKVKRIKMGKLPVYEPGIEEALRDAMRQDMFTATTDLADAVEKTEATFIAVPTPEMRNGCQDSRFIDKASRDLGRELKKKSVYHLVVVKSTVLPETTQRVVLPNLESGSGKKAGSGFGLCMNPEFLREGSALKDFLEPDRIVIGQHDRMSGDILESVFKGTETVIMRTDLKTAEMIKYASNIMLASKITLANEIGNICKKVGVDTYEVMKGVSLDKRVSPHFLRSGIGFGGSCFKKDINALICKSDALGYDARVLKEIIRLNREQPFRILDLLKKRVGSLKGRNIAVLGVAFKGDTDDIRESPAIHVVDSLLKSGAHVSVYDPRASDNFRGLFPGIKYHTGARECLTGADACLILSEWKDFRELSDIDFSVMKNKVIIEGRRMLNPGRVRDFEGVCW